MVSLWNGTKYIVGMLLNSRFVDKYGQHPDGVIRLFHYGDEASTFVQTVGSSDVHSQDELQQIARSGAREVSLQSNPAAAGSSDAGVVTVTRRPQTQSDMAPTTVKGKRSKGLFLDSPEDATAKRAAPRPKKRMSIKAAEDADDRDGGDNDADDGGGDDSSTSSSSSSTSSSSSSSSSSSPSSSSEDEPAVEDAQPDESNPDGDDEPDADDDVVEEPPKLNRDTSAAFQCRAKVRSLLAGLNSSQDLINLKLSVFRKLCLGGRGRCEPRTANRYPKCPVGGILDGIEAISQWPGGVGVGHSHADAFDEKSVNSVMTHDEPWKLELHLVIMNTFLAKLETLLDALHKTKDVQNLVAAILQLQGKAEDILWNVPDDIYEIVVTDALQEAWDAVEFCLETFAEMLVAKTSTLHDNAACLHIGLVVHPPARAQILTKWTNRLVLSVAPSSPVVTDDALTELQRVLNFFFGKDVVLDGVLSKTLRALQVVSKLELHTTAAEVPSAVAFLETAESKASLSLSNSPFYGSLLARAAAFEQSQAADIGLDAKLADIVKSLADAPVFETVPNDQAQSRVERMAILFSATREVRATCSSVFLHSSSADFERVDDFRVGLVDAILKRCDTSFYTGLEASLTLHPLTMGDFSSTNGGFSLLTADELLLPSLLRSIRRTDTPEQLAYIVVQLDTFGTERASRESMVTSLKANYVSTNSAIYNFTVG